MPAIIEPGAAASETLADLLHELGDIPLERIRRRPAPGTATEKDVIAADARDLLCELVDGVLVEKPMGLLESRLANSLIHFIEAFLEQCDLGVTAGEAGTLRLAKGLVRIPDVAFIRWGQLPRRELPSKPIPSLYPDLAVEILRKSNTRREMLRKTSEYLSAGARLVWLVDPSLQTAEVYTSVTHCVTLNEDGILDGAGVLPGFRLRLGDWLDRPRRSIAPPQ